MPTSRLNEEYPSAQVTGLRLSCVARHNRSATPEILDEKECVCRATFSEEITSQYSEERTGIKLHLCVCHIQDTAEDPWFSLEEPHTPQPEYLSVPASSS